VTDVGKRLGIQPWNEGIDPGKTEGNFSWVFIEKYMEKT
jgi:hypothetical protein